MSAIDVLKNKSLVDYVQGVHPDDNLEMTQDGTWRCACPLHNGKNTTSFTIFPNNRYFCFSCQSSGDLIGYVMQRNKLMFFQAVDFLADKFSIDLDHDEAYTKQKSLAKQNELKNRTYVANLSQIIDYLTKERGLSEEIIKSHQLGYCTDKYHPNTLSIPMRDLYGRLVAFGYRYFDCLPKYKNTANNELFQKGSYLFNVDIAARMLPKTKRLYVVEGHIDAMSIEQQGEACVAYCGITFTKEHVAIIKQISERIDGVTIIIVPDNDDRASAFVERGRLLFARHYPDSNVRVAKIKGKEYKDANDLLKAGTIITDIPTDSIDIYCCKQILAKFPNDRPAQSKAVAKYTKTVNNSIVKAEIANMLAKEWGLEIKEVKEFLCVSESATTEELTKEFKDADSGVEKYMQMIQSPGYTLGFAQIDESFKPIRDAHVVLIGAYSKVGKTDVAIEILLHSVVRLKMPCMMFSLEMSEEAFWERLLCKLMGMSSDELAEKMCGSEFTSIVTTVKEKLSKNLIVVTENNLSIQDIEQRVRLARSLGFSARRIFIDYFQYLKNTTEYKDTSLTARYMKAFVKALDCQLIMLSQFNRGGNNYEEPPISAFRGGNDMESSFDKALLLWRPGLEPKLPFLEKDRLKYETRIKIIDRDGLRGDDIFSLYFNPKTGRLQQTDWRDTGGIQEAQDERI